MVALDARSAVCHHQRHSPRLLRRPVEAAPNTGWWRDVDGVFGTHRMGFNDLGFTASTRGVGVHGLPGPPAEETTQLLMTHDAGASWQVVPIG